MLSIKQVAKKTGVTTRTLRYYDSIGLLKPTKKTDGGHRLYNEQDLIQLQKILFFRQMGFRLKEIQEILQGDEYLDSSQYLQSQLQAIRDQIKGLQKMESSLLGWIHAYEIEGRMSESLIIELIRQSQQSKSYKQSLRQELFNHQEQQKLAKLPNMNQEDENIKIWVQLIQSAKKLMFEDPASEEVQTLIRKMVEESEAIFKGDEELANNMWEVRKSNEQSRAMGWYPIDSDLLDFLDQAFQVFEEKER